MSADAFLTAITAMTAVSRRVLPFYMSATPGRLICISTGCCSHPPLTAAN
jgi:hypothetical protein